MSNILRIWFVLLLAITLPFASISLGQEPALPLLQPRSPNQADWLIDSSSFRARVYRSDVPGEIVLDNGLLRRTFRTTPNGACVGFDNLVNDQSMLRSVRPEARVTVDGVALDVGGLVGQPNHAFLTREWLDEMKTDPEAMQFIGYEVGDPQERFGWGRRRHSAPNLKWPPEGVYLRMDYRMPQSANPTPELEKQVGSNSVRVSVHYELYDGLPVISKWISVHNDGDEMITVDRFTGEELALVEHVNQVEVREEIPVERPQYLHVETDFAAGGFMHANANRHVVHWRTDPLYTTQVNWAMQTPCLLVCEPTYGPAQRIPAGGVFEGFRTFELAYGEDDRERRGLALRRMYRTVAPWVTENPLTHHLLTNSPQKAMAAIDQAADVGFEAIILSFGSGFNMENQDPGYLGQWKAVADYAEQKGIELGSYSLFSSRGVEADDMIRSPKGQSPTHGQCPAVSSKWGRQWLETIRSFYQQTGFDQFENDGPYPGDVDTTARPPWQKGIEDSRWVQFQMTAQLYHDLRADGIYINAPDYYYLNGSNKHGMGYREVNWSLPRSHQVIHTRQNIYDGTWTKTPSMGWMFVPLSQYHGGGSAATIEPLHQHLRHYEMTMRSNLGMGVQAHYRGPRLFDTEDTRDMVKEVVAWFKRYRDILESDLIHGRRADGRDIDWMLHVNPTLKHKGMLVVYNPLKRPVSRKLSVNLYYTGLKNSATVRSFDGEEYEIKLQRDFSAELNVFVPAEGMSWYVFE